MLCEVVDMIGDEVVGSSLICVPLIRMVSTLTLHIVGWVDPSPTVVEPSRHLSHDV